MKQFVITFLVGFSFFSCKDAAQDSAPKETEPIVYDMYVPSEMANLMNEMYAYNLKVKQQIIEGKQPTEFPMEFLKIHSAEFTKGKGRNETFDSFSKLFIEAEKELYNPNSEIDLKDRFNNSVNLCISCHQTECTGPIPRIKKLLIK